MQRENSSVRIVQIDGKDIFLSNSNLDADKIGYSVSKNGVINQKRFRATLDYSLELIKLHEVYKEVFGSDDFSFNRLGFEYSKHVCSITFKYSVKEYNRVSSDIFIRHDVNPRYGDFHDYVWVENGQLLGIQTGRKVDNPVGPEILGEWFYFEDGVYKTNDKFKTIMTTKKIREWIYKNGFYMDGVKFVRFMRSAGSARTGKCLFINEALYPRIHEWEMCGLHINEGDECDLAGIESYISLTASSIIGTINIKPENILLVDDYESVFKDTVVAVELGDDKHLRAVEKEVEVVNSIWDGESIIDKSLMGEYSPYGFILLRNSFFKSAAFNCNLQKWFKDNGINDVSQLNGKTLAKSIDQVLYITTPSSIKYLKYGSFDDWLKNISPIFGVVKHEKKPKYLNGKGVKVSYQLINTLAMTREDVEEFLRPSIDYLNQMRTNTAVFRWHIHYKGQQETDAAMKTHDDLVYRILGVSDDFAQTKLFQEFKNSAIRAFISELRLGHIVVNGNYEVLAGNVIELLQHSIGEFSGESIIGYGNISTKRFEYGKTLLGCRSPHTSSGNVLLVKNVENRLINMYFNFTTEIVAVNSIKENILQRLSGADFDSDVILITDNDVMVRCASKYYNTFKVPTMIVESSKKKRRYTDKDKASLDIYCDNDNIGVIVNLSQEINTIMWDRINRDGDWAGAMDAYYDNCLLSILSEIAIDMTKREYPIDCIKEFKLVRAKYNDKDEDGRAIKPKFFGHVAKKKGFYNSERKNYKEQMAPMDYLQSVVQKNLRGKFVKQGKKTLGEIMADKDVGVSRKGYVDLIISMVRELDTKTRMLYNANVAVVGSNGERKRLVNEYYSKCVDVVKNMHINIATMRDVILEVDKPENSRIRRKLWGIVLSAFQEPFSQLMQAIGDPVYSLEECRDTSNYDLILYNIPFKYKRI